MIDAKSNKMFTLQEVGTAAKIWYNSTHRDYMCLAENRLMNGETIDKVDMSKQKE